MQLSVWLRTSSHPSGHWSWCNYTLVVDLQWRRISSLSCLLVSCYLKPLLDWISFCAIFLFLSLSLDSVFDSTNCLLSFHSVSQCKKLWCHLRLYPGNDISKILHICIIAMRKQSKILHMHSCYAQTPNTFCAKLQMSESFSDNLVLIVLHFLKDGLSFSHVFSCSTLTLTFYEK